MKLKRTSESGFTYIELLIAVVILTVGILAMVSALTSSLVRSYESEKRIVAKQLIVSTLESVISAKEIDKFTFNAIRNDTAPPLPTSVPGVFTNGVFVTGMRPIREDNGYDGIAGTADDACPGSGACTGGPVANTSPIVQGYMREIIITDIDDPERPYPANPISRRRVEVKVQFFINNNLKEESMATIVSDYKHKR